MPIDAAIPSRRDTATAVRAIRTKLGPGLTMPTTRAPRMPVTARSSSDDTGSVELQILNPHHAVGDGAQAAELGAIRPQPMAVHEVDDRPILRHDPGQL